MLFFAFNLFYRIISGFLVEESVKKCFLFALFMFFSFSVNAETNVYNIMMMGVNIGKSTETWEEKTDSYGNCVLSLNSVSEMTIARGGFSLSMNSDTSLSVDCKTFKPLTIKAKVSEMGSETLSEGREENGIFRTKITKNGVNESSSLKLGDNVTFFGMIFRKLDEKKLLQGGKTSIISEESLAESEISYSASKNTDGTLSVTVNFQGIPIKYTVSGKKVIRSEMQNGLLVYYLRGSVPEQDTPVNVQKADLLDSSKIANSGISIKYPRKTSKTVFAVESANFSEIPETCFQKKEETGTLIVVNSAATCVTSPAISDISSNIEEDSGNPDIVRTAQKTVLGAPNQEEMVKRIAKFVYKHIKNKNYNHGTLSASEVLRSQSGDCTEHSSLFAALARAVGIPAKMVYGLVMDPSGQFFFHNWNEAFADGKWISVDSTFGIVPADSSRITLIYGGSDSKSRENVSVSVLKFMNNTKIAVQGFSNENR